MGKLPDISETKKQAIIALVKAKSLTTREIGEQETVSIRTVARIKKKMLEGRTAVSGRVQKCGRKKKTSIITDRFIQREFLKNPFKSPYQLANELTEAGSPVSHMTIRRRLKEYGYRSCRPAKKPRLTKSMRQKRLSWAREHSSWTVEDWSKVCFSDESTFECHDGNRALAWHKVGSPRPIIQSVKHPTKVMVWSIMSAKGVGRMTVVEGMMNSQKYLQVLQTRVLPQLRDWFPCREGVFMQDGAPCHTAKMCKKFLLDNNVTVLPWPGNSPDLNPIDPLWAIIKMRLRCETITNRNQMIAAILHRWYRDDSIAETCKKLISTMPERIQAVIDAKGGNTNF